MAFRESSFGLLYFTRVHLTPDCPGCHIVGIVEFEKPWRVGKAIVLQWDKSLGLVFGLWIPNPKIWWRIIRRKIPEEMEDDLWMTTGWLDTVSTSDIAQWDDLSGDEDETSETEEIQWTEFASDDETSSNQAI